jgi:LuxR family maltose regulon positive regulatory protein
LYYNELEGVTKGMLGRESMSASVQEMEPFTFLRTKLHRPRVSHDLVPRPRLVERLHRSLDRKLTLICAPAGFGKTTLACMWLQDCPCRAAWLSLDENDNDLRVFLSYFVAAIQTVFPDACPTTLGFLHAPQLPPLDHIATTLVNDIADLPEPPSTGSGPSFILTLDDYHAIQDNTVHELVAAVISNLPRHAHLVLASRVDPPWPLASLRVGRQMMELRADDLRFTLDEARAFLERVVGAKLTSEAVATLEGRTEGWIAALRLAALSMRGETDHAAFVQSFKGTHRDLTDYLTTEVLSQQPQPIQDFLLRTSILDRFCAPLCDTIIDEGPITKDESLQSTRDVPSSFVAGPPSLSQAILDELDRANLFLVPLDYERRWYRYHHLFQELLRRRLQAQLNEEDLASLHSRASAWLRDNGLIEEALRHALTAGDLEGAAQLVENSRHDLLNREDWPTLERCLNQLPEAVVRERPALLLARAWVLDLHYQISGIPRLLQEAEACLSTDSGAWSESEMRSVRGEIDALWSLVLYLGDEGQRALESAQRALERIPVAYAFARSFAVLILALAHQMTGRARTAVGTLSEFLAEAGTQPDTIVARVLIGQIYVHMLEGNCHQAAQALDQLQLVTSKARLTVSMVVAHWLLGRISYEWNNLEAASQHFSSVFELRYGAQYIMVHDSMIALALTHQTQGMPEKSEDTLAALRRFALDIGITQRLHEIDSFEASLAVLQGHVQGAIRWAETVNSDMPTAIFLFLELPIVTKARVLIAQGTDASLREATQLLQELLAYAESVHNTYHQIGLLALLALAYQAQRRTESALEALERSLRLAQPGGFIRTFVDLGPTMAGLLYQLAEGGVAPEYVRQVLAAFPEARAEGDPVHQIRQASRAALVEPLTRRESEILVLLARQLTNQEIADSLVISPLTVKKHTINIYQKLGVNSRAQAVAQARALGILPLDGD